MTRNELLDVLNIKPLSIIKKGKVEIINTSNKKYVIKKTHRKSDFYEYLVTRKFNYFPTIYSTSDDEVEINEFIEEKNIPLEQKLEDIIYLASILHLNTSFDKDIDIDTIKEIYENIIDKQTKLLNYYQNLQNIIEEEIYMSPANYLLIRNISMIYYSLNQSRNYLEKWYNDVSESKKIRYSYIHGNLEANHLLENDNLYLISWDKSRIDFHIYDLEYFYKKNYSNINLVDVLSIYQKKYPLKKEEINLLLTLILIPDKIDFSDNEYINTKKVSNIVLYLEKTLSFLKDYSKKANNYANKQNKN